VADEKTPAAAPRVRKPRTLKKEKEKANTLVRQAAALREGERRCVGRVKLRPDMSRPAGPDNEYFRTAEGEVQTRPCERSPIKGGVVCPKHGGQAPQVRAKANKRLLAMVEPSLIRLGALVAQEEHLPTALGAIRTVLERAGSAAPIGPLAKSSDEKNMRPIINIGIKVGGIETPVVSVGMQAAPGDPGVEEGEIVDDTDE